MAVATTRRISLKKKISDIFKGKKGSSTTTKPPKDAFDVRDASYNDHADVVASARKLSKLATDNAAPYENELKGRLLTAYIQHLIQTRKPGVPVFRGDEVDLVYTVKNAITVNEDKIKALELFGIEVDMYLAPPKLTLNFEALERHGLVDAFKKWLLENTTPTQLDEILVPKPQFTTEFFENILPIVEDSLGAKKKKDPMAVEERLTQVIDILNPQQAITSFEFLHGKAEDDMLATVLAAGMWANAEESE
jgi:hypothetical protein